MTVSTKEEALDPRFSPGADIAQLAVLDAQYRPLVMRVIAQHFDDVVKGYRQALEACEGSPQEGDEHHAAFDALVVLCVLRAFPRLLKERDALRADLQARAEGRCRDCSQYDDGGFCLPDMCHIELQYAEARREIERLKRG